MRRRDKGRTGIMRKERQRQERNVEKIYESEKEK
jgi:hypothetical protein